MKQLICPQKLSYHKQKTRMLISNAISIQEKKIGGPGIIVKIDEKCLERQITIEGTMWKVYGIEKNILKDILL